MPRSSSIRDPVPARRAPSRAAAFVLLGAVALAAPDWASAKPTRPKAAPSAADRGLELAQAGDCVAAVPELERAETQAHRPATAAALAGCHVALGELVLALDIYSALAAEPVDAAWSAADRAAHDRAKTSAAELDARIPRLELAITPADAPYAVHVAGKDLGRVRGPVPVPPDEKVELRVEAEGFAPHVESVVLTEGAKKRLAIELEPTGSRPKPPPPPPTAAPALGPRHWLGARFRGYLLPTFVMNIAVDGGTTTFLPGGELTYTARLADVDLVVGLGVTSLGLGATAVKPRGAPDTEWEIAESDLVALTATLDILYRARLDAEGVVTLGIGGGLGLGLAAFGDLYRWQAYPTGAADDPASYAKCNGPNDPAGTYRYCNQLDKDAERYGAPDAAWGSGGARPVAYPWVALPLTSLVIRPTDAFEANVDLGVTFQGFSMGTGLRFGLD